MQRGYDYLWLMDDDSIPLKNSLLELIKFAKEKNFGFLCSKVIWKDNTLCKMNIPRKGLTTLISNADVNKNGVPVLMGTFVSFFVSKKVIEKVGSPIKEFFIWSDDLEFSRRISKKYPSFYIGNSVILHKCKSNNGANIVSDSYNRISRYFYAYRNETYLYKKEGTRGYIHLIGRLPYHMLRVLFFAKSHKKNRLKQIVKGTFKGIMFNPQIEYPTVKDSEEKQDDK